MPTVHARDRPGTLETGWDDRGSGQEGMRVMADPDSPAQLRGTVAVNGKVAKRDSDAIVAEIEHTRQSLARTIDSLADRVSPANNVRRMRERAAEQLARPEVQLAAAAVVLAVVGVTIYRVWGRRKA